MRIAIAVLFFALVGTTQQTQAQSAWAEKMFPESREHNFGSVPKGGVLLHRFKVTNLYAVRMEITNLQSGCGCAEVKAEKRALEPRESTYIEARMFTSRFDGAKSVLIRVTVGPQFVSSTDLKLVAVSRRDVVFNPGEFSFGSVLRGQSPVQSVDLDYAGPLNWKITEVISKDIPYTVNVAERVRKPGAVGYTLTAKLDPNAPIGALKHEVLLRTNDPASPVVSALLEANVQAAVTVTPPVLNLGTVQTDTPLIRRVVVRGVKPFKILGVDGTGSGVELGAALSPRAEMVHFVTFKCQFPNAGAFQSKIQIRTSAQDEPVDVVIDGVASK